MKTNSPDFLRHDAQVRTRALTALRARRRWRRGLAVAGSLGSLAILLVATRFFGNEFNETVDRQLAHPVSQEIRHQIRPEIVQSEPQRPDSSNSAHPATLTDEELIALFPPGSCFLAEVNGKKMLVFKDPEVRKQFFN